MACGCCDARNFKQSERWSSLGLHAAVLLEAHMEPVHGEQKSHGHQGHDEQVQCLDRFNAPNSEPALDCEAGSGRGAGQAQGFRTGLIDGLPNP